MGRGGCAGCGLDDVLDWLAWLEFWCADGDIWRGR
jgi:hypothetical protein